MKRSVLAIGNQLALRADLAVGHAIASATDLAIRATGAVAVRHAEGAALRIGTLATGPAVGVALALGNAALVGTADARDTDVALVHRLAIGVFAARRMADAVNAGLARATLRARDAGLAIDGLGQAVLVLTDSARSTARVAGAGLLAQSIDAGTTGTTLTIEHTVIRRNRRLLALAIEALIARTTVGLDPTALRGGGGRLRLAGVARGVANKATCTVGLLIAVTSFGTLTVGTAVTAGRTLCRRCTGSSRGTTILGHAARNVALEATICVAVSVKASLVFLGAALLCKQCDRTEKRCDKRKKTF